MVTVVRAEPDRRAAALMVLYSRLPPGERESKFAVALDAWRQGVLLLDDLWVARCGDADIGAILAVRQPGSTALLWPPEVIDIDGDGAGQIADLLIRAAGCGLDEQGVLFTQVLLEPGDIVNRELMTRNGFPQRAELLLLERDFIEPLPTMPVVPWEVVPFQESERARFASIIERTYQETRDCPSLSGVRSGGEALVAHRASGVFEPARWSVFQQAGRDVGALLLADHPDRNQWEVVYLGVLPELRGRGFGRAMLTFGLHQARAAGRSGMFLAVDAANSYAVSIYKTLGFQGDFRRVVHLRLRGE